MVLDLSCPDTQLNGSLNPSCSPPKNDLLPSPRKIIIDTDPGIDDAMAILMAFESPEVEVVGLTTIFGNAETSICTRNALHLLEVAGFQNVPVAEGSPEPLKGGPPRIAYFAHGSNGLGDTNFAQPKAEKFEIPACDFLIKKISECPGEMSIVALGPLTNIAQAIKKEKSFAKDVKEIFILGGAFFSSGNVNPAAEANIFGDPEAADIVFTSGAEITVVGINISTQVLLSESDLNSIRDAGGRYGDYVFNICKFYKSWHSNSDSIDGIFLHDPTCLAAVLEPSYFTYKKGTLRVETEGLCRGYTLFDMGLKKWNTPNPWTDRPHVKVAWSVDHQKVIELVKARLMGNREIS